ncbi:putative branched-chain-amino-acid aminotransferase protein [Lasiodiplodia theobromae]|nr:Branched-chain-amino-acid aminotransferase [Lasiodiplodia theobromae]KAF4538141.1 Branched-chain-amino-acid aminotransferase [Lasiodiplodia theobromae]KAF9637208.1 putative branched-chain-amino-acid aminotransferase protein [Lasiodiplodia theobromae]KAK0654645.1 Branched-chain-amino-acid aminotransferase [Lasiodiplodia hormozganensis]
MSPSAVNPTTVSGLTEAGIEHHIVEHPPSGASNGHELAQLDASKLTTTFTTSPRPVPEPNSAEVIAQKVCTDHMITVSWTADHGWHTPELKPYGPLSLMPTASCLHYATECFEGMKLYRGFDGKLRLFRPDRNAARLLTSANRISLPSFEPAELEKLIAKLCAVDGPKWLPVDRAGQFLYIRPTFIADDEALGVNVPKRALLYVIICNFPNLDKPTGSLAKPGLKLLASRDDMVRAWPGGFGYAKLGANYGPSLIAQGEARARGFDQILWLLGNDCLVTEAGASNFFVVWRAPESNKLQIITAPLDDRIILDGVTRRSVLELVRTRLVNGWAGADAAEETLEGLEIVERKFTMSEVVDAAAEGRLVEAFAAGTAFFIAPVGLIHFRGKDIEIPLAAGETGKYAHVIKTWLRNIMYGKEDHEWARVVPDEGCQA